MNIFKIAWRSIQHRGLGSLLTILSMALGVMMVVAVLSIHGLVSQSFKNNNSFGYDVIVGARGGGMQLTMNTVYYLSQPVENVPYEYYLAFEDADVREANLANSFAVMARDAELEMLNVMGAFGAPLGAFSDALLSDAHRLHQDYILRAGREGQYKKYAKAAVPLCLGDYWEAPNSSLNCRCVGTTPGFFEKLVLDVDTEEKFKFAEGRNFQTYTEENGFHECVVGYQTATRGGVRVGDVIYPTHGDPQSSGAHIHEEGFKVVGIVDRTGTPNDRVVFLNMEGFFLMEGHEKPVEDDSLLRTGDDDDYDDDSTSSIETDEFETDEFETDEFHSDDETEIEDWVVEEDPADATAPEENIAAPELTHEEEVAEKLRLSKIPLPIEQREVTALLISTVDDEYDLTSMLLPPKINQGDLARDTLNWSAFRPVKAQTAAQAVNPVIQVNSLFALFVDPVRWLLLALTAMICVVSAISILVGIYNSMSQRQHEIAVMRALGASRTKVMSIMLVEAILLACLGGLLGWFAGHVLNASLSPIVESRTGVPIGFFDFAPGVPLGAYFGNLSSLLPPALIEFKLSPELLLIPGLILLAVLVGVYPAISAYKTDVSNSLGK